MTNLIPLAASIAIRFDLMTASASSEYAYNQSYPFKFSIALFKYH